METGVCRMMKEEDKKMLQADPNMLKKGKELYKMKMEY
jgi:hypothetical protein